MFLFIKVVKARKPKTSVVPPLEKGVRGISGQSCKLHNIRTTQIKLPHKFFPIPHQYCVLRESGSGGVCQLSDSLFEKQAGDSKNEPATSDSYNPR